MRGQGVAVPKYLTIPTGQGIMASEVLSYNMFLTFNPDLSFDDSERDSSPAESLVDELDDYMARLEWEEYQASIFEARMKYIEHLCDCKKCLFDFGCDFDDIPEEDENKELEEDDDSEEDDDIDTHMEEDRMTPDEFEEAFDNYDAYCCALD